jgi:hypothetical protein
MNMIRVTTIGVLVLFYLFVGIVLARTGMYDLGRIVVCAGVLCGFILSTKTQHQIAKQND